MSNENIIPKLIPVKSWDISLSSQDPCIVCISGPYIDQLLFKDTRYDTFDIAKTHHDAHHDAHHNEPYYRIPLDAINDLRLPSKIEMEHIFKLNKGLRFREESFGLVIRQGRNIYAVNKIGSTIINHLKRPSRVGDIYKLAEKLNVRSNALFNFLKLLILFRLVEVVQ